MTKAVTDVIIFFFCIFFYFGEVSPAKRAYLVILKWDYVDFLFFFSVFLAGK